jgi:hypothetical protein
MFKKFTALGIALLLCAGLFLMLSCNNKNGEKSDANSSASVNAPANTAETSGTNTLSAYDHGVLGKGRGVMPGRVVWAYNKNSVNWNGKGFWWNPKNFDLEVIKGMMANSVKALAGKETQKEAWDALFKYNNNERGRGEAGYQKGEKIAIKINMNGVTDSLGNTNCCYISPEGLYVLLSELIENVGAAPEDITVFDASRVIPDHMIEYCSKGNLKGVNFKYKDDGGANDCVADKSVKVIWSESFPGETCYLPKCVTEADYIINLASIKGHDLAGVTLCAKNNFGTIMASNRFNPPQAAGIHGFVAAHDYNAGEDWTWPQRPLNTYTALVDLMSNTYIADKTVLYMFDAFFSSQSQNQQMDLSSKWQAEPFNYD